MTRRVRGMLLVPLAAAVLALLAVLVLHPSADGGACPRSILATTTDPHPVVVDGAPSWACYDAARKASATVIGVVGAIWTGTTVVGYLSLRDRERPAAPTPS